MLLSSIQIQGFKSFADKTVLKFGKGITAVVGPNGSGKSNISDAVRWVLGEQSTKSLRGQSMEDVIFGGTDTRRPHGFCEVTLNIDNSDRTLNFDNDSVSVTRKYYRSHESEYLINNVSVRLKDVHELFMDTGLGRDGYSMIGQGKIDNIISSKSDERRDIFEEASGISKYRYRKAEAEKKLFLADDNLLRLKDIMSELESRVGPLKDQSEKAERFLELANEKKDLEIGLWLYTLNTSKDTLRAHESKIDAAQIKYKEIEDALSEFEIKSENNTELFAKITAEIEEKRSLISTLNEESVKLEGDISLLNNDILHNEDNVNRLIEEKSGLNISDNSAKDEITKKRELADEKTKYINTLNSDLSSLESELSNLLLDSERISRNIEELARNLNRLTSDSSTAMVELTTVKTTMQEILSRKSIVDNFIKETTDKISELNNEAEETNKLLSDTEETIESYKNTLNGYKLKLDSRNEDVQKTFDKCQEIKLDIESKSRRVQILKELESSMEGFSKSVISIINESDKGVLRGINGTVSKVITVDKKYSVAIETALGNNIQNIIVDTENDAKRAINYLKSNNLGRATFMPLSSIKSKEFKENGFEELFGFVGIAADLVTVDDKYSEVIRYLLGGAVIAEDIDCAVTMAKKYNYRVKIVSLDGQVVNPGGSLTGGSHVKQAGILSRSTDIKLLNEKIEKKKAELEEAEKQLHIYKEEADKVSADIKSVTADLTSAGEDRIRIIAEIKRLEELILAAKSEISSLNQEKSGSDVKINSLKQKADNASALLEQIESEKNDTESKINEMTGGRNDITNKREVLSQKITDLKMQIIENEKDAQQLINSANELELSVNDRATRYAEIDSEIAVINYKTEQLKNDIGKIKDQIDDKKFAAESLQKEIEQLHGKRNETEKAGIELRTKEREHILEREKIGGELARLFERKNLILKEYDDIIAQLYDEYGLTRTEADNIGVTIEKPAEAKKELSEIRSKIRALGNVNVSAIEEYKEVKERYDFMSEQIDDVERSKNELLKLINELTVSMKELFLTGFNKINENFTKTFRELFGGGSAFLKLTDSENILESGIDIEAHLPGKNVPSLDGLSGGEKALVALSIYFAIMQVNAPPFCFLDEVDTALDDINVDRFADYMKHTDSDTQFICVTHRRGTMEAADMLYGVTMQEKGVTKLLELNISELEKKFNLENKGA